MKREGGRGGGYAKVTNYLFIFFFFFFSFDLFCRIFFGITKKKGDQRNVRNSDSAHTSFGPWGPFSCGAEQYKYVFFYKKIAKTLLVKGIDAFVLFLRLFFF